MQVWQQSKLDFGCEIHKNLSWWQERRCNVVKTSTGVVQPILLPNKQKETTRILQPGDLMPLQQKQRNIKTLSLDVFKFER